MMTLADDNKNVPIREESRWLFSPERLRNTPSIKLGMSEQDELAHRQQAASLIRQIGLKLKETCRRPSGLSMDTAMVFMHRFYVFHSFQKYPPHTIAPCALFLAAKCEETPLKLEFVIKTCHMIQNPIKDPNAPTITPKEYEELSRQLIANENLLLQTLGFELIITHPHTSVVNCGDLVGAQKYVTRLAYELATNSLHFTTMCLKYKPTTVACVCLHMAFKTNQLSIPKSKEGKDWWNYLDQNLTSEALDEITKEFVGIIEKCRKAFNKWVSVKNQQPDGTESSRASTSNNNSSQKALTFSTRPTQ